MDELDKKIKNSLNKNTSLKYNKMIEQTMKMIENGEITREKNKKSNVKFIKFVQSFAAVFVIGILSITTYAGVTGKFNINTGNKKLDENYDEVATEINKTIENDYFTLTLESMAADPAYLIFEYDLKFKDLAMEQIDEIPYNEFYGYSNNIWLNSETYIEKNEEQISIKGTGLDSNSIEKIAENEFKIVEILNIAHINSDTLHVNKKINNLIIYSDNFEQKLNVDIGKNITLDVIFKDTSNTILAESVLSNGSTLYIEKVSNSKFENFVLSRIVTKPVSANEFMDRETMISKEFMIEDPQFAICNQDDELINHSSSVIEDYYEKMLEDGTFVEVDRRNIKNTDIIRVQEIKLLKLGFPDGETPEKIKIIPLNRKLYNDRNNSEYEFYMNEDWYQVKVGDTNITEDSQIGGKVTITKIEETDDKIIFYYDTEGFVPHDIDFVVRVKSDRMNYTYPKVEKHKYIDDNENKIIYSKELYGLAGLNVDILDRYDNLDNLEFAMFYNVKYDILSEKLEFEWPEMEENNTAVIENIEISDFVNENMTFSILQ